MNEKSDAYHDICLRADTVLYWSPLIHLQVTDFYKKFKSGINMIRRPGTPDAGKFSFRFLSVFIGTAILFVVRFYKYLFACLFRAMQKLRPCPLQRRRWTRPHNLFRRVRFAVDLTNVSRLLANSQKIIPWKYLLVKDFVKLLTATRVFC